MGSEKGDSLQRISVGGVSGTHRVLKEDDILLAPTTVDEKNTIKAGIVPIGCWRVDDIRFEFDSSLLLPAAGKELPLLKALREKHKDAETGLFPPLSVFGHADPTGDDEYNKILSGRRAASVYGLLTRDTDLWERLYHAPFGRDEWEPRAIEVMLQAVSPSAGNGGQPDEAEVRTIRNNKQARAGLFRKYMDRICGADFILEKKDFLARGGDAQGKGDFQGCGEFNPVLLFSQEEEREFRQTEKKEARNTANASNRRVIVLLFRAGSRVSPGRWPCPHALEGTATCRKRFWSDGEKRRGTHLPLTRRLFEETHDTFACRFYHRLTDTSPCERTSLVTTLTLRLLDGDDRPFAKSRYILIVRRTAGAQDDDQEDVLTGATNENGILQHRIPADADRGELTLFPVSAGGGDPPPEGIWRFPLVIKPLAAANTVAGAQARLNNLGLFASETVEEAKTDPVPEPQPGPNGPDQLTRAIQRFQMLYRPHGESQEKADGRMDAPTQAKLEEKHGS